MNQTTLQGKRGVDVLRDPELNKSTAFTEAEKQKLGIVGLVPEVTETEDVQLRRVLLQLSHKTTDLDRYIHRVVSRPTRPRAPPARHRSRRRCRRAARRERGLVRG